MRAQIRSWLINDPTLIPLIGTRVYPANMRDTRPDVTPYIVLRFSVQTPRIVPVTNEILQVWAHDTRGDYGVIDDILKRTKEIFTSQESQGSLFAIEWMDTSEDQYDEGSATLTKWSRFQMVKAL